MKFDANTFKALSSPTRLKILKSLGARRMTMSELSKRFSLHVSTVKEHLDILESTGLIIMEDEGYKWKYYNLTPAGKNIVFPYNKEIEILFPLGILFIIFGMQNFILRLVDTVFYKSLAEGGMLTESIISKSTSDMQDIAVSSQMPIQNIPFVYEPTIMQQALLILGIFIIIYAALRLCLKAEEDKQFSKKN